MDPGAVDLASLRAFLKANADTRKYVDAYGREAKAAFSRAVLAVCKANAPAGCLEKPHCGALSRLRARAEKSWMNSCGTSSNSWLTQLALTYSSDGKPAYLREVHGSAWSWVV